MKRFKGKSVQGFWMGYWVKAGLGFTDPLNNKAIFDNESSRNCKQRQNCFQFFGSDFPLKLLKVNNKVLTFILEIQ